MIDAFKLADCYVRPHAQLCWDCKKACGGCSWSKNFEPVPGWIAEERVLYHRGNGEKIRTSSYHIRYCPEFERDDPKESL